MTSKIELAKLTAHFPFILFYQGDFTESPTLDIINIVQKNFDSSIQRGQLKRFIYLIIEALQNIERYSAHVHSSEDFTFIFSDGSHFHIITQNSIYNSKIENLTLRLDDIISKNEDELEEAYKLSLVSEVKTEKGAGLGLIEIARKSKNKLLYSFEKKTEEFSDYTLGVSLPMVSNNNEDAPKITTLEIKRIITALKDNFNTNNSTLFYGGDMSNAFIKSLFNLLKSTKTDKNSINTKTHHILIELIQNILKHSYRDSESILGQLFLEWKDKSLEISTYNHAKQKHINKLDKKLQLLAEADEEKLKKYSKDQLMNFSQIDGLGLIDISVLSYPEKIKLNFVKKTADVSELILSTKVNYE